MDKIDILLHKLAIFKFKKKGLSIVGVADELEINGVSQLSTYWKINKMQLERLSYCIIKVFRYWRCAWVIFDLKATNITHRLFKMQQIVVTQN